MAVRVARAGAALGRGGSVVLRSQMCFAGEEGGAAEALRGFVAALGAKQEREELWEQRFAGKAAQTLQALRPCGEVRLLQGLGAVDSKDGSGAAAAPGVFSAVRNAAGAAVKAASQQRCDTVVLQLPRGLRQRGVDVGRALECAAQGAVLANWAFDGYVSDEGRKFRRVEEVVLVVDDLDQDENEDEDPRQQHQRVVEEAVIMAQGTLLARDVVNERADVATPLYFQTQAEQLAAQHPQLCVRTVGDEELRAMGAGLITAVGQAATVPPRIVFVEYRGRPDNEEFHGLLGKGVTYDTGGLNLKPTGFMEKMYMDCGGASCVLGTMQAVARLGLPVNVVGVMALAENAIDAKAYKPGAILKSLKGTTVEVGNTDAEGRLCLADAMTLMQRDYKLLDLVEFSTLTGACAVALGEHAAGLFCNRVDMLEELEDCGMRTAERVWRMPLLDEFSAEMEGGECDLSNTGESRYGGACTAAAFLKSFVELKEEEGRGWAHVDIAGPAMASKPRKNWGTKNGTGFGALLMAEYLRRKSRQGAC